MGHDEIGKLGDAYDVMVQKIKGLIQDNYLTRIGQRDAELKALQAQMNPHFLYNTLNTIYWAAHQRQEPVIAEMVYALSQFLRLRLNDGKDVVSLEQEFALIEHYLHIQQHRFGDRLSYEIMLDESLRSMMIPKLILQPLVENSLMHGIEQVQSGFVQVSAAVVEDAVVLTVTDNGKGMSADVLAGVEARLSGFTTASTDGVTAQTLPSDPTTPPPPRHGFALQNIQERLDMFYHSESSLTIRSREGLGTSVSIRLPYDKSNKGE